MIALAVSADTGWTWLIVVALLVLVFGRRLVLELLVAVAGRLRRAPSRPEDRPRRRPGADLHLVDGVSRGWVGASSTPDVTTWPAPREAAPVPSPRRAA